MTINDYGFTAELLPENTAGIPARVTAVHRERYAIVCDHGETYARLKTKEYYGGSEVFPTVGDFVMIHHNPSGDSQITATLPRRSFFSRRQPGPTPNEQAVAANFDYVFIMQSMNMDFNPKRLERYLTLAWQSGATPVVMLTKADLAEAPLQYLRGAEAVAAGVGIHIISTMTGEGLDTLVPYLQPGKTIVFLGSSGVGKSSLVNALAGKDVMSVSAIREDDSKGRHTTTHRQLFMLESGVMIIDTPGMRELGMWEASEGLSGAFADVEQYLGQCRFRDCSHSGEPGCAVRAALEAGTLDAARWESYRKLKEEAMDKDELLRRKGVAKSKKQRKKERWQ